MAQTPKWDADLYAEHTAHHRAFDAHVLDPCAIEPQMAVLDLGSGAGDLTATVAGLVPDGFVLGIDASGPLVDRARRRFADAPNVAFEHRRAQDLAGIEPVALADGKVAGPPFDLVVTVATLHWVPGADHPALYRAIASLLVPGGRFRADFGGEGQIAAVRAVLDEESARVGGATSPWYFPPAETVADELAAAGLSAEHGFVRIVNQRRSVPDLEAFVGWLDSQVLVAYEPSVPPDRFEQFRSRSIERLESLAQRDDGSFDQDYVRVDLLVERPR